VNPNGSLARASAGLSSAHTATGVYTVTFPGSVAGCAAVANLGYPGTSEQFTHATSVTTLVAGTTVRVDVTYPGDLSGGTWTSNPVLVDNSFHLDLDCGRSLLAAVNANGTLSSSTAGVTAARINIGVYTVNFAGSNITNCAPVATVTAPATPGALAAQTAILRDSATQLTVYTDSRTVTAADEPFSLVVTCSEATEAVFPSSNGFFNSANISNAEQCALTGDWYDPTPGGPVYAGNYISTWANTATTGGIQTKNAGYGVAVSNTYANPPQNFGVDLVATC
jgi:hypothetical protein